MSLIHVPRCWDSVKVVRCFKKVEGAAKSGDPSTDVVQWGLTIMIGRFLYIFTALRPSYGRWRRHDMHPSAFLQIRRVERESLRGLFCFVCQRARQQVSFGMISSSSLLLHSPGRGSHMHPSRIGEVFTLSCNHSQAAIVL